MPPMELMLPFFAATFAFAALPGPGVLYTVARTLAGGRAAGLSAVLGLQVGGLAHVAAASLGLSAVFQHAPIAFAALKIAGAVYLMFLGGRLVLLALRSTESATGLPTVRAKSPRRAFVESVVVELLNPKTAVFFIAFLPQFVDPSAAWPIWAQFLALGVIVSAAFGLADLIAVFATETLTRAARGAGLVDRIAKAAAGSMLIGLGAHLALSRQN